MNERIENIICWASGVSNDNNIWYIFDLSYLINPTFNDKQFCFGYSDVNCMVDCFLDRFGVRMDMSNGDCYIISDTSIRNNNN